MLCLVSVGVWDSNYTLRKLALREVLGGFSYALINWMICICWLSMLITQYDVSFTYEHDIGVYCYVWWWLLLMLCYVSLDIAYAPLFDILGWVMLWGFTWSLNLGTWCWVMTKGLVYVVMLWTSDIQFVVISWCWSLFSYVLTYVMVHVDPVILDDVGLVLNMTLS